VRKQLLADARVPAAQATLIDRAADLDNLVETLRRPADNLPASFAYDTEFIGESSYHPKLCLLQVANRDAIWLVDPLEIDVMPLLELVADPDVETVVHAGEQDLEPVARLVGHKPQNVIDTQIAAGFCGLPYPASLSKLVEYVSTQVLEVDSSHGLKLGKGYTFTQWDERPLSSKQLSYAADDVRFLPLILDWIRHCLADDPQRLAWVQDECDARCTKAAYQQDGPWERVKGYGGLDHRAKPILRALAVWRDEAAEQGDLPPRALVRDEVLVGMSKHPPKSADRLREVRHMPKPVAQQFADALMAAVVAGKESPDEPTRTPSFDLDLADKFAADSALARLQGLAYARRIDPNLVCNRRDVETLLRDHRSGQSTSDHPLLTGWRGDAVGREWVEQLEL
jgi:ribonuclease D